MTKAAVQERAERRTGPPEGVKTAGLEFTITRPQVEWLYAMLGVGEQVPLCAVKFRHHFDQLDYFVFGQQNQPALVAQFQLDDQFKQQNPQGIIGPYGVLQYLFNRYPKSRYNTEQGEFKVIDKSGQTHGIITREPDKVLIQRGGKAGSTQLPEGSPIPALHDLINDFSSLVQRYVGAAWRTSELTDQTQMQLVLSTPESPSAQAISRYLGSDWIITPRFFTQPRLLDFDDIGGYPRAKDTAGSLLVDATDPDRSTRYGTDPHINRFALFWGDKGAGKSLMPKVLFHSLDRRLNADYYAQLPQIQEWTLLIKEAQKAAREDPAHLAELDEVRQILARERVEISSQRSGIEYLRLMLDQLFTEFDTSASDALQTAFNHVRGNEKNGKYTLVHLDAMEELIPPYKRPSAGIVIMPSKAEYDHSTLMINNVLKVFKEFAAVLGPHSEFTIVIGESRGPRERLPGQATGPFRRNEFLGPHERVGDVAEVLRTIVRYNQTKAARAKKLDPFVPGILGRLERTIAPSGVGLLGGEMQECMVVVANRHKAQDHGYEFYKDQEYADELRAKKAEKNEEEGALKVPIGFGR